MGLTFGSCFAGIEGFGLGLERAGFECKWQIEIDPACQRVLKHHWPSVPKFSDITQVKGEDLGRVDVIVGGWPCQDLSVAGKRRGLAGRRSGLFFEFMRIVDELHPRWILAENVPGLFSAGCKPKCEGGCVPTHGGAMGTVIGALADRGYGYAWRVLNAQFCGVPQRRRRVFFAGHLGTPFSNPAKVLFEPESVRRDFAPSREARTEDAGGAAESPGGDDRLVSVNFRNGLVDREVTGTLQAHHRSYSVNAMPHVFPDPARTVIAPLRGQRYDFESETLAYSIYPESGQGADLRATEIDVAPAVTATEAKMMDRGTRIVQSVAENQRAELRTSDVALQLTTGGGKPGQGYPAVFDKPEGQVGYVRRLTPTECLRLQGFPDDWLDVNDDKKVLADSVKYRMIGNAVAVPVAEWIGHRLARVASEEEQ